MRITHLSGRIFKIYKMPRLEFTGRGLGKNFSKTVCFNTGGKSLVQTCRYSRYILAWMTAFVYKNYI